MNNRGLRMGLGLGVFLLGAVFVRMLSTQRTDTEEAVLAVASRHAIEQWFGERPFRAPVSQVPWPNRNKRLNLSAPRESSNWSKSKQSIPGMALSPACRALNTRVVASMQALHLAGSPPPMKVQPLKEILRMGRCEDEAPLVRVLDLWLQAAHKELEEDR
jgi:hypothetical protein